MAPGLKSVLITGCSAGGIGAALAEAFQEKGYHVFATVRNPSKISQTLSSAANVTVLTLDVLSPESIAAAAESVKRITGGGLDVLVNNSGGGLTLPGLDVPIEEGKKLFDLNFWAPLAMLQAFAPLLIEAKGCLVNNSSANAHLPMPAMSKCIPNTYKYIC
jgi:NAD(P)-dependent dehydrogenase (short-subunit alcohol dehydrogenase family)